MNANTDIIEGNGADRPAIIIMGAGPGGICMAIKLLEAGIRDFLIFERSDSPGGTWHNNRYPGLACDVPSHVYSFTFEQKPDWTRPYAKQPEIRDYMLGCVHKYGLEPHIRVNCGVLTARWSEEEKLWHIQTDDGATHSAPVFISALGMFNELQWPDIDGRDDFAGPILHTAAWPEGFDLTGQSVAVVGSAASAVQMVPEIAKKARNLHVFQRTAHWVLPKEDIPFETDELDAMRKDPRIGHDIRDRFMHRVNRVLSFSDGETMAAMAEMGLENLQNVINPELREKMHPHLPYGSQRPLFSNDYYPTFNLDHVELVTDPISHFTSDAVVTEDAVERPVDTIIFATGYAANKFLSVIDVYGTQQRHISEIWSEGPRAYKGITAAHFPNLFMLYGPNTNNGSILFMIECQCDYIIRKLGQMREQQIDRIEVRADAMADYNRIMQDDMLAITPWQTAGSRYYRVPSGLIVTQCPYNMEEYEALTLREDADAYEWRDVSAA